MLIIICLIAAVVISLKSTGFLNEFIHAMEVCGIEIMIFGSKNIKCRDK